MAKVMVTEEEKAFLGRMYEQYYDEAVRYARSLTGNSDDAQQIVQDTFMSLLEKGVSDLRERDKFKSYLMTCVRNRFLNQRKKAHREEGGELLVDELFDATGEGRFVSVLREEESIDPALAYEHKELKQELENCLAQLPDEQREVIYLKSILQMKEREIAKLQGVAQATVKSRIRYARARLSQLILEREKKTGVKLHSVVPLLPLLRFLYSQETFPQKSFAELCVAAETGAAVAGAASSTAAGAASSTAAGAASSTAAGAASSTAASFFHRCRRSFFHRCRRSCCRRNGVLWGGTGIRCCRRSHLVRRCRSSHIVSRCGVRHQRGSQGGAGRGGGGRNRYGGHRCARRPASYSTAGACRLGAER